MPEYSAEPHKAFVVHAITIVQTCHGHNTRACCKQLETAARLFMSTCRYDAHYASMMDASVSQLCGKMRELRFADQEDHVLIETIKRDCLTLVRGLHEISEVLETRSHLPVSDLDHEVPAGVDRYANADSHRMAG